MVRYLSALCLCVFLTGSASAQSEAQITESLKTLTGRFLETKPLVHNQAEWQDIRQTSKDVQDLVASGKVGEGMDILLTRLSEITPGRENTAEWAEIREACKKLLQKKTTRAKLFGLLAKLQTISPARANVGEWAAIRSTAEIEFDKLNE
ncbi:MAG: hypothetical protein ACO1RT_13205 [Planctomycetaceae bacterium]